MKKFILTLVLSIYLIPQVNAECVNLLTDTSEYYFSSPGTGGYKGGLASLAKTVDGTSNEVIRLDSSKTYTLYLNDGTKSFNEVLFNHDDVINEHGKYMRIYNNSNIVILSGTTLDQTFYTFTPENSNFNIWFYGYKDDLNTLMPYLKNNTFWLVEGDSVCINTSPPNPEPIVPDSTLNTFYSIYLDKLVMLSDYASENKFLLTYICIILAFISLEILFNLFYSNGRRHF